MTTTDEILQKARKAEALQWYGRPADKRVIAYQDDKGDETIVALIQDGTRTVYHQGDEYFVPTKRQAIAYADYIAAANPSAIIALIEGYEAQIERLTRERDEYKAEYFRRHKDACDRYEEIVVLKTALAAAEKRIAELVSTDQMNDQQWRHKPERADKGQKNEPTPALEPLDVPLTEPDPTR